MNQCIRITQQPVILICDPDGASASPLIEYLNDQGYVVHCIKECKTVIDQTLNHMPALVLIDTHLPQAGGYRVCDAIRPYFNGPILFQGDQTDEAAQLLAFEHGGDDFIFKPISPPLMAARINAHIRRIRRPDDHANGLQVQSDGLLINATRREVSLDGRPLEFTTIQFDLLWYLARCAGRVVSRKELYQALRNDEYNDFDRSMDVYVSRIRRELEDDHRHPHFLKTVRGVGYLFIRHPPGLNRSRESVQP